MFAANNNTSYVTMFAKNNSKTYLKYLTSKYRNFRSNMKGSSFKRITISLVYDNYINIFGTYVKALSNEHIIIKYVINFRHLFSFSI